MKKLTLLLTEFPEINLESISIAEKLITQEMTILQFHNKKAYLKRKKDLNGVLILAIAYEIYQQFKEVS